MDLSNRQMALNLAAHAAHSPGASAAATDIVSAAAAFLAFLEPSEKVIDAPKAKTGKKSADTSASAKTSSSDAPASTGSQQRAVTDASGSDTTDSEKTNSGDLDFFGEDEKPAAKKEEKKAKAATLDNVREKLVEVQTALKHKDHAIALLAKHTVPKGTKALSALPEANYAALIAEGDASIKAGKVAA